MEMIIVIFFFSLSSAVCIQIFTKAHSISRATEEMSDAVLWGENAGELFYEYKEEFADRTAGVFDRVPEGYEVVLDLKEEDGFLYLDYAYVCKDDDRTVYTLSFKQHVKEVCE